MDGFVKVTLTQPYAFGRDGESLPVAMTYGFSESRVILAQDAYGRDISKTIPGKPNKYVLDWNKNRSIIMPEGAARMYFGQWDLPEVIDPTEHASLQIAAGLSTDTERKRVADVWGGFVHAKMDMDNKRNYLLPIIDVPKVPHVAISPVNESGDESDFTFDPWTRYQWEASVTPLDQLPASMQLPPGYINPNSAKALAQPQGFSEAQMMAAINAAVKEALEKATAPARKTA